VGGASYVSGPDARRGELRAPTARHGWGDLKLWWLMKQPTSFSDWCGVSGQNHPSRWNKIDAALSAAGKQTPTHERRPRSRGHRCLRQHLEVDLGDTRGRQRPCSRSMRGAVRRQILSPLSLGVHYRPERIPPRQTERGRWEQGTPAAGASFPPSGVVTPCVFGLVLMRGLIFS
jgi:hypothetical protein